MLQFILLFTLAMAAVSACFWVVELSPFLLELIRVKKENPKPNTTNKAVLAAYEIKSFFLLISILPLAVPFVIDIISTTWLAASFGFGGTVGGCIGLFISNIISVVIIGVSAAINAGTQNG